MERWAKQKGKRLDYDERKRKRTAREAHQASEKAQNLRGLRAKQYAESRRKEKIQMKKQLRAKEQKNVKSDAPAEPSSTPLPQYLLDRSQPSSAKALSSSIKDKRKEAQARFSVPLPKVRGITEDEMFKVIKTGKSRHKSWKRMITKPTFVGGEFTRRPVKYESKLASEPHFGSCPTPGFQTRSNSYLQDLFGQWVCGTRRLTSPTKNSVLQCNFRSVSRPLQPKQIDLLALHCVSLRMLTKLSQ